MALEILATGQAAAKAFTLIKNNQDVQWTSATPPTFFDVQGPFMGHYSLGTDYLIKNKKGQSYISYGDFALAIVEELSNKEFIQKRFTAVGEKN